jgi:hypothetical protein
VQISSLVESVVCFEHQLGPSTNHIQCMYDVFCFVQVCQNENSKNHYKLLKMEFVMPLLLSLRSGSVLTSPVSHFGVTDLILDPETGCYMIFRVFPQSPKTIAGIMFLKLMIIASFYSLPSHSTILHNYYAANRAPLLNIHTRTEIPLTYLISGSTSSPFTKPLFHC